MNPIQAVWFKRDLRLHDHAPLARALEEPELPLLLVFIEEPFYENDPHYHLKHRWFIRESLEDMDRCLLKFGGKVHRFRGSAPEVFGFLTSHWELRKVLSYEETGMEVTYARDRLMQAWFKQRGIPWVEIPQPGVVRGLKNKENWHNQWQRDMNRALCGVDFAKARWPKVSVPERLHSLALPNYAGQHLHQTGGTTEGRAWLHSFCSQRKKAYRYSISKPGHALLGCSRLSPYLAWGNLSLPEVVQEAQTHKLERAFRSRLHWNRHFVQKLETQPDIEFKNMNPALDALRLECPENLLEAWKFGKTGYPMVDACMRQLRQTGYLNFRMRAMLVSFATHHLWLPWQSISPWLASCFLDFEPGIHFPQLQMQAGCTGIHTLRIYNPVKQGRDQDPQGKYIRYWVQELRDYPGDMVHEPWKISPLERLLLKDAAEGYPAPMVDIEATGRYARKVLWDATHSLEAQQHARRILKNHVKSKLRRYNEARRNNGSKT
jgi:deoxyribodipyrimidine photo-lyase